MFSNTLKHIVAILVLFGWSVTQAATMQSLRVSELPGERAEINIGFDGTPPDPKSYTIDKPARIVFDFEGVVNAVDKKKTAVEVGEVSSAVVVSAGGRTRVIVNLTNSVPHIGRVEGSNYLVEVGADVVADGASVASNAVAESPASESTAPASAVASDSGGSEQIQASYSNNGAVAAQTSSQNVAPAPVKTASLPPAKSQIGSIDFRRGELGEGNVIIQLTNPKVAVDIEEISGGVEVNFIGTDLPDSLRRTLDVMDFATPVKTFAAVTKGRDASIVIKATGEYDYLAYQADSQYVISVKPLTREEIEEKKKKFAYVGETLSLNFQDIEVRSVLQLIADFSDLNLVASDTVSGNITLRLDNVPWDQALDLVLKTKGLDKRQIGNVLMVAPAAEIAERERQEIETKKQLEELAPTRTEYIRIRYANAVDLYKLFSTSGGGSGADGKGSFLSERGRAIVDERTNSIILTDTDEKINDFKELVERIDIPIRQVMIEARIVRANDDFRRELGVNLSASVAETSESGNTLHNIAGAVDAGFAAPTGTFGWDIINADFLLDLELMALEEIGLAEIVSQPKVITGDKQEASIESGTEVAYQEESASGGTTTSFKEVLLKLLVTPQITPDGRIIMDLEITQDNISSITPTGVPVLDVTGLETQVLVADGETVVLGGVYQNQVVNSENKVPVLGDIPWVGNLFRSYVNREEKSELLLFITPRIMDSIYSEN